MMPVWHCESQQDVRPQFMNTVDPEMKQPGSFIWHVWNISGKGLYVYTCICIHNIYIIDYIYMYIYRFIHV